MEDLKLVKNRVHQEETKFQTLLNTSHIGGGHLLYENGKLCSRNIKRTEKSKILVLFLFDS